MPAVVIVPGATGAGRMRAARRDARTLARQGVLVASFNAEGRSSGRWWDLRSGGTPNLNGSRDQDGLAAVISHLCKRSDVDAQRVGIYAISFGLAAALGAIQRHPSLPVRFVIDEEGPTDRFAAALEAWRLAPSDGADWPARARALFGTDCSDDAFWASREPIRCIAGFRGHYLRLQADFDHVQPPAHAGQASDFDQPPRWWPNKHAIELVNAAVDAGVPWVRVNPSSCANQVNARWSRESPPAYFSGHMTDHPMAWVQAVEEVLHALQG